MPYSRERVARRLKSLRADLGWDQQKLADEAKLSKDVVVNVENARTGINLDSAFDLTNAMGCTLEQLVCRDESVKQARKEESCPVWNRNPATW